MLIHIDQLEESEKRFSAVHGQPSTERAADLSEEAFLSDVPAHIVAGNLLGARENIQKRKEMLSVQSKEPLEFAFERAIGRNDAVYSNFVDLIVDAKRKVGRIARKIGSKNNGCATGFMVSDQLMLTNWHVFKTIDEVADSEFQFFYELDTSGNPKGYVSFKLRSDLFFYSCKELDYCFVAVNSLDITGKTSIKEIGYLYLDQQLGKLGNEEQEALNIIHHPDGDFKQLSIRENIFKKITPTTIWYASDTAPGSSGSPVFNDQWQIVALHHMGVAKRNSAGAYIDKDGAIIPVVGNKIDESRVVWIANEGIRISVILKDMLTKFPADPFVQSLKMPFADRRSLPEDPEDKSKDILSLNQQKQPAMDTQQTNGDVNISFPASLIESRGFINININNRDATTVVKQQRQLIDIDSGPDFDEIKKLENEVNLSNARGYERDFLGIDVPMPQPKTELKKFIAKVGVSAITLRYYHYSVLFHTVRMMPAISAINVDGNLKRRLDKTERVDVWLRDRRIDFDVQLDDQYYSKSGFDRGHMSRREDANWGFTAEDAKRNADLTCFYTNACPQVAAINRSMHSGLWGMLENAVLERGAIQEGAKTRKISVFNGPIFKDSDPVYKGIQVPMSFFKIVLWLTDDWHLKATAFKLSQDTLVGDIDFEQMDIDQDIEFKEYQCSILSLEEATKLDFSGIRAFDTFQGAHGEEIIISSELDLKNHLDDASRQV